MNLQTSYRQIISISLPIMIGGAVQNIIALSDSVFLFHRSEEDFAAIGFVSVFYLIIAAIGFGFSRAGQIVIARRCGERDFKEVGRNFWLLLYFELALSVVMFLFMWYGTPWFFALMVNSDIIYTKSLEYLEYRSFGVFFSYAGVALVALYTGIARTIFVLIDTLVLAVVNIILNYALIFGHFGFPEMGIAGAGLASTIAEVIAFILFICYMIFDRDTRKMRLWPLPSVDLPLMRVLFKIGLPMVAQAVVGLGSWFFFFSIIENLGERSLAVTNLVRIVYLCLSIPCWGFATGINTIVSNFIGSRKRMAVLPMIWKTAKISWLWTAILAIPAIFFPEHTLWPLLGKSDMSLIHEAQPIFYLLLAILSLFSVTTIYFNGLVGTGAAFFGLKIQMICVFFYLSIMYYVVEYTELDLIWAWASELVYWILIFVLVYRYLMSKVWYEMEM